MSEDTFGYRVAWSWRGRGAAGLFALNTLLLFFPPIPPYIKGSLWSYLLKTAAVVLAMLETYRLTAPAARSWDRLRPAARHAGVLGGATALLGAALALRASSPGLFERFSAEVGPWETISTAVYACGLVGLWKASERAADDLRRHTRLVAACFGLLLLEETDYAGLFGGVVGRIDGVYVGSLHDLLNLAAHGGLHPVVLVAIAGGTLAGLTVLWRRGYLAPAPLFGTLWSAGGLWLVLGLLLLVVAGAGEAALLGSAFAGVSPEEALEMAGSVCIAGFGLHLAARAVRSDGQA